MNCYCLVAQLCLALCDPMDCSPPGFSVHGIREARILEWVAISFSRVEVNAIPTGTKVCDDKKDSSKLFLQNYL